MSSSEFKTNDVLNINSNPYDLPKASLLPSYRTPKSWNIKNWPADRKQKYLVLCWCLTVNEILKHTFSITNSAFYKASITKHISYLSIPKIESSITLTSLATETYVAELLLLSMTKDMNKKPTQTSVLFLWICKVTGVAAY